MPVDNKKILRLLETHGFKQNQLAKMVGTTPQTINKIVKGNSKDTKLIAQIAAALRTDPLDLLIKDRIKGGDFAIKIIRNGTIADIKELPGSTLLTPHAPILGWDEVIRRPSFSVLKERDSKHWAPLLGDGSLNTFVLRMDGLSMTSNDTTQPHFLPGTHLYFDPLKVAEYGDFVLVKIPNQEKPIFRKYILDCGEPWLYPQNYPAYPAIKFTSKMRIIAVCYDSRYPFIKNLPTPIIKKQKNKK